jgi:hypothetical protein
MESKIGQLQRKEFKAIGMLRSGAYQELTLPQQNCKL